MLLLLFPTLPTGARRADLINGRTELGCQCFLQSLRLELGAAPLPLCTNCLEEVFSETQRARMEKGRNPRKILASLGVLAC